MKYLVTSATIAHYDSNMFESDNEENFKAETDDIVTARIIAHTFAKILCDYENNIAGYGEIWEENKNKQLESIEEKIYFKPN
ncbi:hypothetical protein [Capybara microvirus Cap3_SP_379]|nr:hypothetical protein [Capybara microvirus Cap3_SP_379]